MIQIPVVRVAKSCGKEGYIGHLCGISQLVSARRHIAVSQVDLTEHARHPRDELWRCWRLHSCLTSLHISLWHGVDLEVFLTNFDSGFGIIRIERATLGLAFSGQGFCQGSPDGFHPGIFLV